MENRNRLLCVLDGMCHPPRTGGDQAVFNALKIIHVQHNTGANSPTKVILKMFCRLLHKVTVFIKSGQMVMVILISYSPVFQHLTGCIRSQVQICV